jgi:hypothetical protein
MISPAQRALYAFIGKIALNLSREFSQAAKPENLGERAGQGSGIRD